MRAAARTWVARAALIAVMAACAPARAQTPIPDAPSAWVTDKARLLSLGEAAGLDARLAAFESASGHQVLVYIDRTTGGVPLEDWTVRAFARWRVGRKGIDDGVVLFVFTQDRCVRIEVGYGLEDRLPDARAARIVDEVVVPAMRAGRPDEAVRAGAEALLAAAGGAAAPAPQDFLRDVPGWALAAGPLLVILAMIAFATNPSLAPWLLLLVSRGRWSGGSGRGNGGLPGRGFTGGGGRSGGGGASGSW